MKLYGVFVVLSSVCLACSQQCLDGRSMTFTRWSGVTPETATPVFMYTASGNEASLVGACLERCRSHVECAGVIVSYGKGSCQGIIDSTSEQLKLDNDFAYFKKICLEMPKNCAKRWWVLDNVPGNHLHPEHSATKVLRNTTVFECYDAVFAANRDHKYRSAQWVLPQRVFDVEKITASDTVVGNCILCEENRFTEPESYRVSNYYTFYIENQCTHDYSNKIERCSYEEYYNQTLMHVEKTINKTSKDECMTSCEVSDRFICRGFTWTADKQIPDRGLCDLHSEDFITTGSWLLRRTSASIYYRRVICLNITVQCKETEMIVTYKPRSEFRGRVYVPGRGEKCSARATGDYVRLTLPLRGDCDVSFAYGITDSPSGYVTRSMAYVMLMIQNNPIIQTAGDRWVRVGCSPNVHVTTKVDTTLNVKEIGAGNIKPPINNEMPMAMPSAASTVYGSGSNTPVIMYVVRALDDTGASSVSLGESLEMRIESSETSEFKAYHLVASSKLGDSSVLLLNSKGCPTGQVDFPEFTRSWLGGMQRLSARFKAFRFPTSHVVRFALMIRFCKPTCPPSECGKPSRVVRETNETIDGDRRWHFGILAGKANQQASLTSQGGDVVAQGGVLPCPPANADAVPLELEMMVDSKDILSADTLVRADHHSTLPDESQVSDGPMVCIHELLLVSLALAWLAVQIMLLIGCCVLVKRYRNLAEFNMQKDYQSFDNVGFDSMSTHRRVHWPDQNVDILHVT